MNAHKEDEEILMKLIRRVPRFEQNGSERFGRRTAHFIVCELTIRSVVLDRFRLIVAHTSPSFVSVFVYQFNCLSFFSILLTSAQKVFSLADKLIAVRISENR